MRWKPWAERHRAKLHLESPGMWFITFSLSVTSYPWLHFRLMFNQGWQWEMETYPGEISCYKTIGSCIKYNCYCLVGLAWKNFKDLQKGKQNNSWAMNHMSCKTSSQVEILAHQQGERLTLKPLGGWLHQAPGRSEWKFSFETIFSM